MALDQMIGDLAAKARKLGAPDALLKARLRRWLALEPPARWLVIEPDPELLRIVITEMEQALSLPVIGCSPEECCTPGMLDGVDGRSTAQQGRRSSQAAPARQRADRPPGPSCRAGAAILSAALPAGALHRSGRHRFALGRLPAHRANHAHRRRPRPGVPARPRRHPPGWKRGLDATSAVVCDAATRERTADWLLTPSSSVCSAKPPSPNSAPAKKPSFPHSSRFVTLLILSSFRHAPLSITP